MPLEDPGTDATSGAKRRRRRADRGGRAQSGWVATAILLVVAIVAAVVVTIRVTQDAGDRSDDGVLARRTALEELAVAWERAQASNSEKKLAQIACGDDAGPTLLPGMRRGGLAAGVEKYEFKAHDMASIVFSVQVGADEFYVVVDARWDGTRYLDCGDKRLEHYY